LAATLVGKVEAGIPEDDPRNPATIADNVGDNVGDCAGMAADLFETYAVTVVATMVLASIFFVGAEGEKMMLLPLVIGGACVITSIIGTFFVRLGSNNSIMGALYKGFWGAAILSIVALAAIVWGWLGADQVFTTSGGLAFTGMDLFFCGVIGLLVTGGIIVVTEYYTGVGYRPVRSISQASVTGHGTNVIQGLAISLEATALPALIIIAGIISTFLLAGLFGIAIAVTTMLALAGIVVALDAFGPVTDNAGGIAEMADLPPRCVRPPMRWMRLATPPRPSPRAMPLARLVWARWCCLPPTPKISSSLQPTPNAGLLLRRGGGRFLAVQPLRRRRSALWRPAALSLRRHVDDGCRPRGGAVVEEVRRQFKADPGIMAGTSKPDYARAVDMLTRAAIKEMIVPSMLPVLSPIVVFFVINAIAGKDQAFAAVGAMLLGVIVNGLYVAVSMTAGGGAWDNAKKSFEDGFIDKDGVKHEKGSEAHKASVTGDTVGDPYKDTAGPAVNPMIKITNIVALLLLAVLAHS
jgi:K(+)-stimulated pyrophosphate-energized sodium pump